MLLLFSSHLQIPYNSSFHDSVLFCGFEPLSTHLLEMNDILPIETVIAVRVTFLHDALVYKIISLIQKLLYASQMRRQDLNLQNHMVRNSPKTKNAVSVTQMTTILLISASCLSATPLIGKRGLEPLTYGLSC